MKPFNPKPRPCPICRNSFIPCKPMQSVCSPKCAVKQVKRANAAVKVQAKAERVETKRRKEADKSLPQLIKEADTAFMAFIRLRDRLAGFPCISSGRPLDWSGNKTDAGHYRSRGAASHLRYNEDNCHAQSKRENRYLAGNAVEYRIRLIDRIGLERVEALEVSNETHKWDRDEVRAIRDKYKAMAKEMRNV